MEAEAVHGRLFRGNEFLRTPFLDNPLASHKLSRLALGFGSRPISITNVSPVRSFRRIRGTEPPLRISSISASRRGYWFLYASKALATINAASSGVFICAPICPPLLHEEY